MLRYSKSMREQLLTLDMTEAIVIAMTKYKEKALASKTKLLFKSKTWACIDRIHNRVLKLRVSIGGAVHPVLSVRDYNRYQKLISKLKAILQVDGASTQQAFDLCECVNAAMALVDDRIIVARNKKLKTLQDWLLLHQSLNTFYTHIDPELDDDKRIRLGDALSRKITKLAA